MADVTNVSEQVAEQPSEGTENIAPVTFEILPRASSKGEDILSSSDGYTYIKNGSSRISLYWVCSQSRRSKCLSRAKTTAGVHSRSGPEHNHDPKPSDAPIREIVRDCKESGTSNLFTSAGNLVEKVVIGKKNEVGKITNLPTVDRLSRKTNRKRSALKPRESDELNFELDPDFVHGFLRADVSTENRRMILFADDNQLSLIQKAKRLYCDGTFRVVKKPFVQLFTIHSFIKQKSNIKRVPLAFIFMTGKSKKDYKIAFEAFRDLLLPKSGVPDAIVMDYEAAIWSGVRKVFPNINIKGCSYHYTQAIYRKVQEIGLQVQYVSDLNVKIVCRQLMALIYLPMSVMVDEFKDLYYYCEADEKLMELYVYVNDTWMNNSIWSIEEICVFEEPIRSNNDVEGWHRRLNSKARQSIGFYSLLSLLEHEADMVQINVQYLKQGSHIRFQRAGHLKMQKTLFDLWDAYNNFELSSNELLLEVAKLIKE